MIQTEFCWFDFKIVCFEHCTSIAIHYILLHLFSVLSTYSISFVCIKYFADGYKQSLINVLIT